MVASPALRLKGFNHLTKTLSVNGYNLACTPDAAARALWQQAIAERYSCAYLTQLLVDVAANIGASVLNVASQTYTPQGASVTLLIAEQSLSTERALDAGADNDRLDGAAEKSPAEHVVMHLDKSHLTAHTYPESDPASGVSNVRVDLDISTCGLIPPVSVLNYLLRCLRSDIVHIDYRVRGFARDTEGKKHFIDHKISSIQDFLAADIAQRYQLDSVNLCAESIFHTKMVRKTFEIEEYLCGRAASFYSAGELAQFKRQVREEMTEISRWGI